jgi:plastocyanin
MHGATLHLLPILGAEKSKIAFYIAGGALAVWAVVVSVGLGLRMPDFPRNVGGERAVIAITVVLVLGAMSSAVLTSGVPAAAGGVKAVTGSESATTTPSSPAAVGSAPGGKATASALSLTADPQGALRYDKTQLKAPAGKVTIDFTNSSPTPHNVTVATQGGSVVGHTPTGTGSAKVNLTLQPGSYVYYCSVPGHRQAGMQGTLVVS